MSDVALSIDLSEWEDGLRQLAGNFERAQAILEKVAQIYAFQDIQEHFKKEEGPSGAWAPRSPVTQHAYAMIAAGNWKPPEGYRAGSFNPSNKLLQLSGHLRQSILPSNIKRQGRDAVVIFSNDPKSRRLDEGDEKVPARPFMWLSDKAQDKMATAILQMLTEGGGA